MINLSVIYRLKALACEKLGQEVPNKDFKQAWQDIAIEWHTLASRAAQLASKDQEYEISSI
jgi:hypothetical protein